MRIRQMNPDDETAVLPLVLDLWPDAAPYVFADDLQLVAETAEGAAVGFAFVTVRPFSNACVDTPCPHLEGWYVAPGCRGQGVGRALVAACEAWAREQGFSELGSDVLLENTVSLAAHARLGFSPVERVQYFRKAL